MEIFGNNSQVQKNKQSWFTFSDLGAFNTALICEGHHCPQNSIKSVKNSHLLLFAVGYQSESDNLRIEQIGVRTTKRVNATNRQDIRQRHKFVHDSLAP